MTDDLQSLPMCKYRSCGALCKSSVIMQVSMAAGKAGAAQQRQQEREAAAQKRAAARARGEKRAAVAAEQKADRGPDPVPLARA